MSLPLLWLQLAGIAGAILFASHFLTKSADVIGFKTGLGRTFIGVMLLATVTSLPELGTGISAVAWVGEPDLAAGDAFGSNLFNLLIIALMDVFWRNGPILNSVGTATVVVGALGMAGMALAAVAVIVHNGTTAMSSWYISPISGLLMVVFVAATFIVYNLERNRGRDDDPPEEDHEYAPLSLPRAALTYLMAGAVVVGAAIWLAETGDRLADKLGWEASYVGTQFLAFSTSLPEVATAFAALRLKAPDLAVSTVLGSNLFNMGIVLFLDDLAYTEGVVWASVSNIHSLTAVMGLLMIAVVIIALVIRPRRKPGRFWTPESVSLIGLYVAASLMVFYLA